MSMLDQIYGQGFEFGFGAEIGISTQKLHARGPMGLEALTTIKYVIFGDGSDSLVRNRKNYEFAYESI